MVFQLIALVINFITNLERENLRKYLRKMEKSCHNKKCTSIFSPTIDIIYIYF